MEFPASDFGILGDLSAIAPQLILAFGALFLLMAEVFVRRPWPRHVFALVFLAAAFAATFRSAAYYGTQVETLFSGLLYVDTFSLFFNALIILGTFVVVLISGHRIAAEGVESPAEYFSLLLMSTLGAIIFVSAAEGVVLFIGLELMSLALYCLCGSGLAVRRSGESALKYFLLGSFASAFLLYGIALLYGLTGSTEIIVIQQALADKQLFDNPLLYFAIGLLLIGFAFKVGAVPFHFWAPDVYQGAPTSITSYMACVVKAAAVGAMLRVMWTSFSFGEVFSAWSDFVWLLAIATMTLGNLCALRQKSLKRMLAYSSIAHAGYILVAFLAPGAAGGGAAILFYLCTYTVMTLGAFGVVLAVSERFGDDPAADNISHFNGLGYARPMLGIAMSLFMLSLAGLPPGFAGLLGKFYLLNAAVKANYIGLAIIAVLNSTVSCFYYLNVIVAMYFRPTSDSELEANRSIVMGPLTASGLSLCAAGTVLLGLFPSYVYRLSEWAVSSF